MMQSVSSKIYSEKAEIFEEKKSQLLYCKTKKYTACSTLKFIHLRLMDIFLFQFYVQFYCYAKLRHATFSKNTMYGRA